MSRRLARARHGSRACGRRTRSCRRGRGVDCVSAARRRRSCTTRSRGGAGPPARSVPCWLARNSAFAVEQQDLRIGFGDHAAGVALRRDRRVVGAASTARVARSSRASSRARRRRAAAAASMPSDASTSSPPLMRVGVAQQRRAAGARRRDGVRCGRPAQNAPPASAQQRSQSRRDR